MASVPKNAVVSSSDSRDSVDVFADRPPSETEEGDAHIHSVVDAIQSANSSIRLVSYVNVLETALDVFDAHIQELLEICEERKIVPAIVFDIDDTVIFRRPGLTQQQTRMCDFVNKCSNVLQVFFVTARQDTEWVKDMTTDELGMSGIFPESFRAMIFCPAELRAPDVIPEFKLWARETIEKKCGVHIVATVGDRFGDHFVPMKEILDVVHGDSHLVMVSKSSPVGFAVSLKMPCFDRVESQ